MALPRQPIPDSNLTSYLHRFHAATQTFEAGGSDTIAVTKTHNGTLLEIKEHALTPKNIITGFELYNEKSAYSVNALVYVQTGKTYTDGLGNSYYSVPGVYICVSPVPPKIDTKRLTRLYLKTYYEKVKQKDGIIYAPIVVPDDTREVAYKTKDEGGMYWRIIAPAVTVDARACKNGMGIIAYTATQLSGSGI
jgi:hypothetical protein